MQLSRLISMIVLAIIVAGSAALLTPAFIPVAKAQDSVASLTTTRDAWHNIWYGELFGVTAISTENVGANLTCVVTVYNPSGYIVYQAPINLSYVPSVSYYGHYVYSTNMEVATDGYLIWLTKTTQKLVNVSYYGIGSVVEISCGGKSDKLVFEHIAPKMIIRTSIPYPPFYVGTGDVLVYAPDLNKNPSTYDTATIEYLNITNLLYGGNISFLKPQIAELDTNLGIFGFTGVVAAAKPVPTFSISHTTPYAKIGSNLTLTYQNIKFNVTFNKLPSGSGNYTAIYLGKGSVIPIAIAVVNKTKYLYLNFKALESYLLDNITGIKNNTATQFVSGEITLYNTTTISLAVGPEKKEYKLTLVTEAVVKISGYVTITNYSGTEFNASLSDVNIQVVKIVIDAEHLYAYAWIAGVKLYPTIQPQPYEVATLVPYQENAVGATGYDEAYSYLSVFKTAGAIYGNGTLYGGLALKVVDAGANFYSYVAEEVTANVQCYNPSTGTPTGTPVAVTLKETGTDTGIFTATEDSAWLLYHFGACLTPSNNELYLSYIDAAGYLRTYIATVAYHTGAISVSPSKVIPGYSVITITVKDKDLMVNPTYVVSLSAGSKAIIPFIAKVTYSGTTVSKELGRLIIYAYNDSGSYLLTIKSSTVLRIIEVSPGVYELKLALSDLSTIPGIKGYEVIYEDYYTASLQPINVTATIGVIPVGIYVYEKEVPLTAAGPVVLHVKVIDPSLNTNPLAVDTAHVTVEACTYAGACTSIGTYTIYETGENTGVFEGAIAVSLKNLGPKYIGGYLKLEYYSPAKAETLYTTVKLEVYGNVALYINGSTGPLTVKYGETLALQLHDMYYELNQLEVDKIPVSIANITYCTAGLCENLKDVMPGLEFEETGADTGVFVAYMPVNATLGDVHNAQGKVCFTLYHIYRSPSTSPSATTWMYDTTQPVKVCIVATPAKFEFYQGAPGAWAPLIYNESLKAYTVGPHAVINVTILDDDWNKNPKAEDTIPSSVISVVLIFNNGTTLMLPVTPKETGPNTGAFSFTIDLTKYKASALAGGKIVIQYKDYVVGGYKKITEEIYIRTWNPTLIIYYNGKELKMPYPSVTTGSLSLSSLPAKLKIVLIDKDLLANSVTITLSSTASIVPLKLTLYRNWSAPVPTYVGYVTLVNASQLAASGQLPVNTKDVITITYVDELPYPYTGPKTDTWKVNIAVSVPVKKFEISITKLYVESGGKPVTVVKAGSVVKIAYNLSFSFIPPTPPSGKIVLEIFGPSGATVFVWEHSGVIYPGLSKLTWTVPKITGKYTIKLFVVYKYAGKTGFAEKSITIEVTS